MSGTFWPPADIPRCKCCGQTMVGDHWYWSLGRHWVFGETICGACKMFWNIVLGRAINRNGIKAVRGVVDG